MLAMAVAMTVASGAGLAQERGGSAGSSKKVERKKVERKKKRSDGKSPRKEVESARAKDEPPAQAVGEGDVEFIVKTLPRGATIIVDGAQLGEAPLRVRARRGRRVISARLKGHVEAATTVEIGEGIGYLVFSLAPTAAADKPAPVASDRPAVPDTKRGGFGAPKMKHADAMQQARFALKRGEHADALRYAEAALASVPDDQEALMIATIAACGVGDAPRAKRSLPAKRGSYREVSITRCGRLGVALP